MKSRVDGIAAPRPHQFDSTRTAVVVLVSTSSNIRAYSPDKANLRGLGGFF